MGNIYEVCIHSKNGFLKKYTFSSIADVSSFLCSLDLEKEFPEEQYGKTRIRIYYSVRNGMVDISSVASDIIIEMNRLYRELSKEYAEAVYDEHRAIES